MIDLTPKTIRRLFEHQVMELTRSTIIPLEESFDYQFSGEWLK